MHRYESVSGMSGHRVRYLYISLHLVNGTTFNISVSDKTITEYMQFIYQHNPEMLVGEQDSAAREAMCREAGRKYEKWGPTHPLADISQPLPVTEYGHSMKEFLITPPPGGKAAGNRTAGGSSSGESSSEREISPEGVVRTGTPAGGTGKAEGRYADWQASAAASEEGGRPVWNQMTTPEAIAAAFFSEEGRHEEWPESSLKKNDDGQKSANKEELQKFVSQNFLPSQKLDAIKFYREATGVGLAEARDTVERLFAERGTEFAVPAVKPRTNWRYAGIVFIVVGLISILPLGLYSAFSLSLSAKEMTEKVGAVSESERQKFLKYGYTEYKTKGKPILQVDDYEEPQEETFGEKTLYVFKASDGSYLGIVTSSKWSWKKYFNEYRSGLDIFYDGSVESKTIEETGIPREITILRMEEMQASRIYGRPSESYEKKKKTSLETTIGLIVMSIGMGAIFLAIGVGFLCRGKKEEKQWENM